MMSHGRMLTAAFCMSLFCACCRAQTSISNECLAAVSSFSNTIGNSCNAALQAALQNPLLCGRVADPSLDMTFNCMNLYDVLSLNSEYSAVIRAPREVTDPADVSCPFCSTSVNGTEVILPDCAQLIQSTLEASSGFSISATYGVDIDDEVASIQIACSNSVDSSLLAFVRYQSEILCGSIKTFGLPMSDIDTVIGSMDMRNLMQCGICAAMPCMPGEFCPGHEAPIQCPRGYYCPSTTTKLPCKAGHYCPIGTVHPIECQFMAAGSCAGEGNFREVLWMPLFFSLFLSVSILGLTSSFGPQCSRKMQGNFRAVSTITKSASCSHTRKRSSITLDKVRQDKVRLSFENLVLTTGFAKRLRNVSGHIQENKVTAIVGGSGAGKTSLMNVLLGREQKTSGEINFVDANTGFQMPSDFVLNHVAFVPQNDILIRSMTVEQLLYHSARSRLPANTDGEEIDSIVDSVLLRLDIEHTRHVQIGTSGRGLSMGERKKVNIGVELVAGPQVLFLDEPTTSVDTSAAMNVMKILQELADSGLTCVVVIHQPRAEIFNLIDSIIVLAPGGRVAYNGPSLHMLEWFELQGFPPPHRQANKIDFVLDLTTGKYSGYRGGIDCSIVDWGGLWEENGEGFLRSKGEVFNVLDDSASASANTPMIETKDYGGQRRRGFFGSCGLYMYQACLQRLKHAVVVQDTLNMLFGGVILGIVTCGDELFLFPIPINERQSCPPGSESVCTRWQRFEIGPATFLVTMVLGAMVIPTAVRTFGREKDTFSRERAVGANKPAYFIGKLLVDLIFNCYYVFVFLTPTMAIAPWRSPVGLFYVTLLSLSACISSIGYALSFAVANPDDAVLAGTIICVLFNLFGGFVPRLGDGILGVISYTRYTARAIVNVEMIHGHGIHDEELFHTLVPKAWRDPNLSIDIGTLLMIAMVVNVFAYGLFETQFISYRWNEIRTSWREYLRSFQLSSGFAPIGKADDNGPSLEMVSSNSHGMEGGSD